MRYPLNHICEVAIVYPELIRDPTPSHPGVEPPKEIQTLHFITTANTEVYRVKNVNVCK